jgi:type 1 glutamine amidotransferase
MRHVLLVVVACAVATAALAMQASTGTASASSPTRLFAAADALVFGTCESTTKTAESGNRSYVDSEYASVVRVEHVERGGSDRAGAMAPLRVGDRIAVRSTTRRWYVPEAGPRRVRATRPPTAGESGRAYLLETGTADAEGRREFRFVDPDGWQRGVRHVALVGADDEYRSEVSMPLLAGILARDAGARASVAFPADPATGALDLERRDHIANVSALQAADVAVLFMRWREFDEESWKAMSEYLRSGKPIVGLRTTTHFLRTKDGALDDDVPARVFGQRWISHHGHESKTRILPPEGPAAEHPILRGVRGNVVVPSWLYDVEPLPKDCRILLWGEVVGRDGDTTRQPIVWVREAGPDTPTPFPNGGTPARRMAFTTLGHPGDFETPEVRRLVAQLVLWAAGDEASIPSDGLPATLSEPYDAPPTR